MLKYIGNNIGKEMTGKIAKTLYDHPSDMEPLLAKEGEEKSSALALALIRGAERLRSSLHPITRAAVADLVPFDEQLLLKSHRRTPHATSGH